MVLDSLKNASKYEALHPAFKQAFDYILATDWTQVEPGKIFLDEKNLFINYALTKGKTEETARMETHNQYIDIQVSVEYPEKMGYTPTCDLTQPQAPYNEEKDITFFSDKAQNMLTVQPGQFAIFWPEDGHQPGIGDGEWKKIIVKVKI